MASLVQTWKANGSVRSLAISPDGACVGAGLGSNVMIWDVQTGQVLLGPLTGHNSSIRSVAYSTDGRTLASGSNDQAIRCWDIETGDTVIPPLRGHAASVNDIVFSHDGQLLISGSDDETIRLWDARTGQPTREPIQTDSSVYSVAVVSDGTRVFSGLKDGAIKGYDVATGAMIFKCLGHTRLVRSLSLSLDGRRMASASYDDTVRIWDVATSQEIGNAFTEHTNDVNSVVFSPDGRFIASGSDDTTIRIWDAETGTMATNQLKDHTSWVYTVAFTPDGTRLISGSKDSTIRVWDVSVLGIQTNTLNNHNSIQEQPAQTEIASITTPEGVVSLLDAQDCPNMSTQLDQATCGVDSILSGGLDDMHRCKLKDKSEVVIKAIRLQPGLNEQSQKLFNDTAHELQKWAQCQHPNVMPILGLVTIRKHIGVVTKWQLNGTLPRYLEQHVDVDRCFMSSQIAEGLAYLHDSGVVHGDLRGENVLVSDEGVCQLANFGHSTLKADALQSTNTWSKTDISLRWAAPELFKNTAYSVRSDVYALGMTILEIVTGKLPYAGKNEHAVLFAVAVDKSPPERPTAIPDDSEPLWFLLKWCWELEPEERPTANCVKQTMQRIARVGRKKS